MMKPPDETQSAPLSPKKPFKSLYLGKTH